MEETIEETNVKRLVWVKFISTPTPYIFDGKDLDVKRDDMVLVDTEMGQSIGKILGDASGVNPKDLGEIKPVLRKATEADLKKMEQIIKEGDTYFNFCIEKIKERALPMKLSKVDQAFDKSKVTFYFTAEARVDFRDLLKDLVEKFKTRIELRQIGSRLEAAMLGGIGSCGKELCCAKFLQNFHRVSVKMAKDQNLNLNPNKISGVCGKLKCCLAYEEEAYSDLGDSMPKPGKSVYLEQGKCTVVSVNVMAQTLVAKTPDKRFINASLSEIITEEEFLHLQEKAEDARTKMHEQKKQEQKKQETVKENAQVAPERRSSRKRRRRKGKPHE
jgi:cell fate regulator YaaT (PSP1 superfamily)